MTQLYESFQDDVTGFLEIGSLKEILIKTFEAGNPV